MLITRHGRLQRLDDLTVRQECACVDSAGLEQVKPTDTRYRGSFWIATRWIEIVPEARSERLGERLVEKSTRVGDVARKVTGAL